jgi:hypothetical protein
MAATRGFSCMPAAFLNLSRVILEQPTKIRVGHSLKTAKASDRCPVSTSAARLLAGRWPRYKPELLKQGESVEHQIERHVFPIPEAQYLDVSDVDGTTGCRDIAASSMQDAVVRASKCAFFNNDIIDYMNSLHVYVSVREGREPTAVELATGHLALAT